jgi:4-amino-4-deoxy-L-arabinose transferase-like glycosyltransferase
MTSRRSVATGAVLVIATIVIGAYRLGDVPIDLTRVEQEVQAEAQTLVASTRGTSGEFLPLFFPTPAYPPGREPLNVYVPAILFLMLPAMPLTLRIPSVLVAAVDVLLMYLVARRLCRRESVAVTAAMLLAMSPAHVIYSRMAINVLYPVPFVCLWLWCIARFMDERARRWLVFAGLSLGVGAYSHPVAVVAMPLLLTATLVLIWVDSRELLRMTLLPLAGFLAPLTLWLAWTWLHGDRLSMLANHYRLYDASHLNYLQGLKDMASYFGLSVRSYIYWQYFSPTLLFFSGEAAVLNSARHVGLLPFPVALLLGIGLYRITRRRTRIDMLLLAGLLLAPVAAALEPSLAVRRILVILPFAILIAAIGIDDLFARPRGRIVAAAVLVFTVVQFAVFFTRYVSDPAMQTVVSVYGS